jgi:quinoprotein glucose dehydrogenase
MFKSIISCIAASALLLLGARNVSDDKRDEWTEYLGGPDRNHYSSLTQINPENVKTSKSHGPTPCPTQGKLR